jgi:hypothetical protein
LTLTRPLSISTAACVRVATPSLDSARSRLTPGDALAEIRRTGFVIEPESYELNPLNPLNPGQIYF